MPEEVNRVVTDRVADLLLCTSEDGVENLAAEGISGEGVQLVGNTMIDSLFRLLEGVDRPALLERNGLQARNFVLATLHRPALVDDSELLGPTMEALGDLADSMPVVFPVHPRTRARLEAMGSSAAGKVTLAEPMDYTDFIGLEAEARLVVSDSGGVQEETSVLGTPCLTYRTTTERPVTIELGTNELVGVDPAALREAAERKLGEDLPAEPPKIPLWDGHAGPRAAAAVEGYLSQNP
jgi:UDP-N-acetylglucosamine 2-epimerase (non-hydrolysing)